MIRSAIASVVVAVLAAACTVGAAPTVSQSAPQVVYVTPPPTPTVQPTTTPSPTPAPTPSQDEVRLAAGTAYLAAVKPANAAFISLYKLYRYKTSLAANRQYCAKLAAVARTELLALNAIVFPADTTADARLLIRAEAAMEADLRSCAKATSFANWNRAWTLSTKANDRAHEAANLVRLDLNLPAVPG
jgi:hypothetical protein